MDQRNNSLGLLIYLAFAYVLFVLMATRPKIEGNPLNWGAPITISDSSVSETNTSESSLERPVIVPKPAPPANLSD